MKEYRSCLAFYKDHLQNVILPFWMKNALDEEFGGIFSCFNNMGDSLLSHDKFTWSQGRMLWVLSNLLKYDLVPFEIKEKIHGHCIKSADFLMNHCLLENGNCTFLMDREGRPKLDGDVFDSSIYADCFVIIGLSAYYEIFRDHRAAKFCIRLYDGVMRRIREGSYLTSPYPVPKGYKAHGIPMIMLNTSRVLGESIRSFDPEKSKEILKASREFALEIIDNFIDENFLLHELITEENCFDFDSIAGRYINPGHTIEDFWFLYEEFSTTNDEEYIDKILCVLKNTLKIGWDKKYGGICLFVDMNGGQPTGSVKGFEKEPQIHKVQNDWGNKLWWPHSEALYSTLLAFYHSKDEEFLRWHHNIFEYTFRTFPNPDRSIGEWIQIRDREGKPESKVVALPVKDPFHIIRNLIQIINLLKNEWGFEDELQSV